MLNNGAAHNLPLVGEVPGFWRSSIWLKRLQIDNLAQQVAMVLATIAM